MFKNLNVASHFIRLISGNLVEKEREILDLAYNTVRKHTADAMVKLKERYDHTEHAEGETGFNISRDELATMVGTATESVIRMLSEFKKDNLLRIEGGKIIITNFEKLRAIKF